MVRPIWLCTCFSKVTDFSIWALSHSSSLDWIQPIVIRDVLDKSLSNFLSFSQSGRLESTGFHHCLDFILRLMDDSSKWPCRCPDHFAVAIFDFLWDFPTHFGFDDDCCKCSCVAFDNFCECLLQFRKFSIVFFFKFLRRLLIYERGSQPMRLSFAFANLNYSECCSRFPQFESTSIKSLNSLIPSNYVWLKIPPKSWSMGSRYDYDS